MKKSFFITYLLGIVLFSTSIFAGPPANSQPLYIIIKTFEASRNIDYINKVDWNEQGYWRVEYYDSDGNKAEVKIDPVSGQPKS